MLTCESLMMHRRFFFTCCLYHLVVSVCFALNSFFSLVCCCDFVREFHFLQYLIRLNWIEWEKSHSQSWSKIYRKTIKWSNLRFKNENEFDLERIVYSPFLSVNNFPFVNYFIYFHRATNNTVNNFLSNPKPNKDLIDIIFVQLSFLLTTIHYYNAIDIVYGDLQVVFMYHKMI